MLLVGHNAWCLDSYVFFSVIVIIYRKNIEEFVLSISSILWFISDIFRRDWSVDIIFVF